MIIKLREKATDEEILRLENKFKEKNLILKDISGDYVKVFGVIGDTLKIDINDIMCFPCVESVTRIQTQFKMAHKAFKNGPTIIDVDGVKIGGDNFCVMAGPCSVENKEQILEIAKACKEAGANILRGGAYKPRTSPYSFQGLAEEGIKLLVEAKKLTGMPIVSEIPSVDVLPIFIENVDIIQVGARNMQNFALLKELGKIDKPILLKRGPSATIEELLMSAEYILQGGNSKVILCERGIRTFEKYTRNTLDISACLAVKELSHLPIIVDPSHASGRYSMIEGLSKASLACGADGLIIEVHNNPECALSDGAQSIKPKRFKALMDDLRKISQVVGKKM